MTFCIIMYTSSSFSKVCRHIKQQQLSLVLAPEHISTTDAMSTMCTSKGIVNMNHVKQTSTLIPNTHKMKFMPIFATELYHSTSRIISTTTLSTIIYTGATFKPISLRTSISNYISSKATFNRTFISNYATFKFV